MPTTPMCSHSASKKDSAVRSTTVQKMAEYMANFTSPAARSPAAKGMEKG